VGPELRLSVAVLRSGTIGLETAASDMTPIVVEATYENGVLKPAKPISLRECERVSRTIHPEPSVARESAGLVKWTGELEILDRLISDPGFGILESP
jgi:predicted DNA-binding antitoxin AbrB/MazE fold protein